MKTAALWLGFLGSVLTGLILNGVAPAVLFQPAAAVMVLLPVGFYLLYSQGGSIIAFLGRVINNRCEPEDATCLDTAVSLGFLFGIIGMITGFVKVMANLSNTAELGSGIAVSVISAVYGAVPALLLLPCRPKTETSVNKAAAASAGYLLFCFAGTYGCNLMTTLYAMKV